MGRDVKLPPTLLFPVEIVALLREESGSINRHDRLVKFKYWNRVPDGVSDETDEEPKLVTREFYGYFDSPHDGTISQWLIKPGDRVNDALTPVFIVDEGCDHSVQFGGLCALCGRELDNKDYMGYSDVDRAPIAMSHGTSGLTVSREEAERIESRSTKQLLNTERLILVVDLDQTVIHASVSPEIGRWIADNTAEDGTTPTIPSIKDVRSFVLRERNQQSWYYVKLRPGLAEFLESMNSRYEMHVYTMATRQYALEIAKVIDPDGRYFADRILSRDASGSLLHKDLKRLFPVSTQMVTIIDDRGDVWNWSPNLVRVVPYQFWSNTGDINSQFLPKRSGLVTPDGQESSGDSSSGQDAEDKDNELESIGCALRKLHVKFYDEFKSNRNKLPDVGKLLPAMKSPVFDGCVLLFSGFFPLGTTDLDTADIVQWVRSFGAVVLADFLPSVTHVVARNAGTVKARQAAGQNKLVVSIEWVFNCLSEWQRVDEKPFLLNVPNPIVSDEELNRQRNDDDEEEMDPGIAEGFMRSLRRGDVNWDAMDEELKELLEGDEENEEEEKSGGEEDEDEDEDEEKGKDEVMKSSDKEDTGENYVNVVERKVNVNEDKHAADSVNVKVSKSAEHIEPSNPSVRPNLESSKANSVDSDMSYKKRKREDEDDLALDFDEDWD